MNYLEILKRVVQKQPEDLTTAERVFIRARSIYLNAEQKDRFSSIINAKTDPWEDAKKRVENESKSTQKQPVDAATPYPDVLSIAKKLGHSGKREPRSKLEQFIKDHS